VRANRNILALAVNLAIERLGNHVAQPCRDIIPDPTYARPVKDPAQYAVWLWLFTGLLFLRVVGQVIVVLYAPRWLPPMEQWQSGLLPYPVLLASQILVLTLMVSICIDFSRGSGYFLEPRWYRAPIALGVSYVYFGGMVVRYIVWMRRRPDQRWFGGTIPIIFHSIVAAFIWTVGKYHSAGPS
jgi:hypothetical protein